MIETRSFLIGSVLLSSLIMVGIVMAQNSDSESSTESEQATSTTDETNVELPKVEPLKDETDPASVTNNAANQATMERFDPTEKISEDRSVSFPVDI